ncbi:MAG TPA: DUF4349 domain-containing protein [Gaiellaceae bacterium]|jgi:hypothetical protein
MPANEMTVETLLRAHAPVAPDLLRERVLALEPVRRSSARRFTLVAVGAAAVAAVGVALVHGFVSSGKQPVAQPTTPVTARGAVSSPLVPAPKNFDQAASAKAQVVTGSSGRLQHTDASLELQVGNDKDLANATTRATRVATSLGGYAQSVHYASHGTSILDLRIPAENVQAAIARLSALGTLVSQKISITDLQHRLTTQSDEIAQLRRRIAALQTALKDPSLPDAQRVLLQIKLAESRRALSQRLHARQGTVKAGTMAHVALQIGTKKSIVAPPHRGRIGRMLHSAVGFLALEGIVVLFALIVASPVALVAFLIWLWRRRSVDRLLAA